MRVFLDTNVIVAAVATRGLCADVMREVLVRHELVITETLLDEIKTVLAGKIGVPPALIADLESLLCEGAARSSPSDTTNLPILDPADRILISAALNGRSELFVTGDAEILGLRTIGDMTIVSPRAFWERVRTIVKR